MYRLLPQKYLYNCALTSNRWTCSQSFLRFLGYNLQNCLKIKFSTSFLDGLNNFGHYDDPLYKMIHVVYDEYVAYNEPWYTTVDCMQQYTQVPTMTPGQVSEPRARQSFARCPCYCRTSQWPNCNLGAF